MNVSKVEYVKMDIKKKKKCRRIIKRSLQVFSMALQQLFVCCKDIVFNGSATLPLPSHLQKLSAAFLLCIFFLPASGVIPLHNHPGMTVFSKLLLGKMHIKSYDCVDPTNHDFSTQPSQKRLAKLKADAIFASCCSTSVLYLTTGGNIHSFTAITLCAVLDVLGPPYSIEGGRDCSYYKDYPYASFPNGERAVTGKEPESYGWLEEIEMPQNSHMDGIEYLGPQVIDI